MSFPVPLETLNQHTIVLGKTRSGKSSAMRVLVEKLLDRKEPVCIVDPKGDWWGLKSSADGKKEGYPILIFGGEHADVPINAHSGSTVAELASTGNRPCIVDLGGWMPGERTRIWIDFASTFFRNSRGKRYLVVDEVHNVAPKGKIMDVNAGKMLHWSNRLASEGLGKGIVMIAASQRPQKVHNDFLTSCETLIAMRVIHAADRNAIKDWVDGAGEPLLGKELIDSIAQNKRGEAWVWSPEIGFGPKRVQFPMFATYDSFKAQDSQHPVKLKGWADVDLEEVKTKLADAVKEFEASDPEKLKERIRTLEAELRKPEKEPTAIVDTKAIERAVEAERGFFAKEFDRLRESYGYLTQGMEKIAEIAQSVANRKYDTPYTQSPRPIQDKPPLIHITKPAPQNYGRPGEGQKIAASSNGKLTGPQRKILFALAELRAIGRNSPTREMVAAWSQYSPNGSAFTNPLGSLRSMDLIEYPSSGEVSLTNEGLREVGPANPPDQDEIKKRINETLDGPQRKIMEVLMRLRGGVIDREQLAEQSGYSEKGSAFTNPLGWLRSAGYVDYPAPGKVKAASWLFV